MKEETYLKEDDRTLNAESFESSRVFLVQLWGQIDDQEDEKA